MKKEQLFELIGRIRELTGVEAPIIVGSQALFAQTEIVPSLVRDSVECDFLLAPHGMEVVQQVNRTFGILTPLRASMVFMLMH